MRDKVESEINRIIERLQQDQSPDGAWRYCLESGPLTDAYMIILLRALQIDDEDFIRGLTTRISGIQNKNGSWKLFHDEAEGNLSASIEAYYALLLSGYCRKTDEHMLVAKQFILSQGGISEASMLTKVILALTGQYPWPRYAFIPIEFLLLPQIFPIHFFDFFGYARVHIAPILVCVDRKFVIKTDDTPALSDLYTTKSPNVNPVDANNISNESRSILLMIRQGIKNLPLLPRHIHSLALRRAEQFMLERIESDGTLYSYFTTTFLMIFALMALGYSKDSQVILRAINGLKTLTCRTNGHIHVQNATSTVWNTALLSHAMQEAEVSTASPIILKAGRYLLERQHQIYGDWMIRNPHVIPGGWGFSDINTMNPDVDDTTASLRAIRRLADTDAAYRDAWNRGLYWLLSMQNADGGWPAFEKNTDKKILTWIPIDGSDSVSVDPSTADLTGRTLDFLGSEAGFTIQHPMVQRGVRWLLKNQERDGSWKGRWGICYIYGTWAAVTGMAAVGISPYHPSIQKAVRWLLEIQNEDGGWGESCRSDTEKKYVSLEFSTPSQAGWALDALISVFREPIQAIDHGVHFLTDSAKKQDWTATYPTGAGLPGGFYFHYHSYRYIWPLLALSHYKKKYLN